MEGQISQSRAQDTDEDIDLQEVQSQSETMPPRSKMVVMVELAGKWMAAWRRATGGLALDEQEG